MEGFLLLYLLVLSFLGFLFWGFGEEDAVVYIVIMKQPPVARHFGEMMEFGGSGISPGDSTSFNTLNRKRYCLFVSQRKFAPFFIL